MAITGEVGAVFVSKAETAPQAFADKPTTGDADKKRYQVTDPNFRYWSPDDPVTVEVDGDVVTSGFTLEYAGGFVVFPESQGDAEVTVSGKALTLIQAGGFFNWSVDGEAETIDVTTFDVEEPEDKGWKRFIQGLKGWSGSAEAYWGDRRFFDSLGKLLVIKLFVDSGASQACLEGFAIINGDGLKTDVGGVVEESVDFTGSGPLYPRF
jgi:hypothetical protein